MPYSNLKVTVSLAESIIYIKSAPYTITKVINTCFFPLPSMKNQFAPIF